MSNREKCLRKLKNRESREEIGLILCRIDSLEEFILHNTCIVPGRDAIVPESERLFEKEIELHEIVAEYIGIGSSSRRIFAVYIGDDSFLIFFPIVESKKRKIQVFSYTTSLFEIELGWTTLGMLFIELVDHKTTRHIIPLLLEEVC